MIAYPSMQKIVEDERIKLIAISLADMYWRGRLESKGLFFTDPCVYEMVVAASEKDWPRFKEDAKRVFGYAVKQTSAMHEEIQPPMPEELAAGKAKDGMPCGAAERME